MLQKFIPGKYQVSNNFQGACHLCLATLSQEIPTLGKSLKRIIMGEEGRIREEDDPANL